MSGFFLAPAISRPRGAAALSAQVADSTATGGNARGANAVDLQTNRALATQVAGGAAATIAGGTQNIASGTRAVIGGGAVNTVTATYGTIPGGFGATDRAVYGKFAFASGTFSVGGDAQLGDAVLRRQTTDATATRLTSNSSASNGDNSVNLPNSGTYMVRMIVAARQTGGAAGTAGDCAGWAVDALMKRGANAAATVLVGGGGASIAPTYSDTAPAAWRLTVAADTTNGGIAISGTGEANKNINWVARVLSVEVVG